MKTIEISDELYEYLKELRYRDCAEAYYTASLNLDREDLDACIKGVIESRDMWIAAAEGYLRQPKDYPWSQSYTETARKKDNDKS